MLKRLGKAFFWTLLLLALLLGADQLLLRVPTGPPWYRTVRSFYTDFRGRLLHPAPAPSVESVIHHDQTKPAPPRARHPAAGAPAPHYRYLYVDGQGQLQFAATLREIPPALRKGAKRLAR